MQCHFYNLNFRLIYMEYKYTDSVLHMVVFQILQNAAFFFKANTQKITLFSYCSHLEKRGFD